MLQNYTHYLKVQDDINEIFTHIETENQRIFSDGTITHSDHPIAKRLYNKINEYHVLHRKYEVVRILYHPPMIIVQKLLPSLLTITTMLIDCRNSYYYAKGNLQIFKKEIRQINQYYPVLINILLGVTYPIEKIVTFSYWDRFVSKIILTWSLLLGDQIIYTERLYKIIDTINGDSMDS